ncbi:MAG: chemotaxis protein CheA [Firmicutes bacterium]|jgi:two-component system chemotaxis sensor kinase CheA|nr:chemotaxis protein CheA [Bacillota bacterium]
MTSDMSRYREVFFAEAQEHLQALNDGLLALEKNPDNVDDINVVFRAAHTIKGMAATMGFNTITVLTHHLEDVLDKVRAGAIKLSPELSDLLFSSVDTLEGILAEAQTDIEPPVETINGLLQELDRYSSNEDQNKAMVTPKKELKSTTNLELKTYETKVVSEAQARGYQAYFVQVELAPDCLMKAVRVFLIFQRLQAEGEILRAEPPVEDLEEEKFDQSFRVLFVTKANEEKIRSLVAKVSDVVTVDIVPVDISNQEKVEAATSQTASMPAITDHGHHQLTTQTVRIDIRRLDNLMNLVGELVIIKTRLDQLLLTHGISEIEETLKSLSRVAGGLQDAVMKARMVPLAQVFNRFPRMVRDLSRELGREVEFTIEGEETELDRSVIDEIGDPLVHLLRNAIDHGIEPPAERQGKGKPAVGRVQLSAGYEGNHVLIMVADDGEGIDQQRVLARAQEKGLITSEQARRLTSDEIYRLLFLPGFSTSEIVSDVSGRGVGLDVVQNKIESLGGTVEVSSIPGQGTRFSIRLPLTLAIIQALMVELGTEMYALPLESVEEIQVIEVQQIKKVRGREVMMLRGEVVPLVRLAPLLNSQGANLNLVELPIVVVRGDGTRAGLVVDNLGGQREIVIKSLGRFLGSLPGLGGATILGDGRVALILDPGGVLSLAEKRYGRLN